MNRYSQVNPSRTYNSYTDIDIPINVLSRLDYIMDIKRDLERQESLLGRMISFAGGIRSQPSVGVSNTLELKLRNLIIWLKDTYDFVVPASDELQNYIDDKTKDVLDKYRSRVKSEILWVDFQTRIARSVIKLIKAVTCANASYEIKKEYVDYAFEFIEPKLEFIGSIDPEDISGGAGDEKSIRRNAIKAEFGGKDEVKFGDLKKYLEDNADEMGIKKVVRKTLYEDLEDIGATSKKQGHWNIPK